MSSGDMDAVTGMQGEVRSPAVGAASCRELRQREGRVRRDHALTLARGMGRGGVTRRGERCVHPNLGSLWTETSFNHLFKGGRREAMGDFGHRPSMNPSPDLVCIK